MLLAFILCFSTLPMTAFAQEADVATEQEADSAEEQKEQQEADSAEEQEKQQEADSAEETSSDKSTTAGEAPDTVKPSAESVSDSDAGTQDTGADDEKKAAVQKVQALIDALPETVTEENAERVSAQLEAIAEAMESLTEEQIAELDMEHLYAISEAMSAPMTVAAQHTHYLCGKETCNNVGGHTEESMTTFTHKLWMQGDTLKIDDVAVDIKTGMAGYSGACYVLPSGDYYLGSDITLSCPIYIGQESNPDTEAKDVNLCLNGKSITANGDFDTIILFCGNSNAKMALSLTDCQGNGKITHADGKNGCGVYVDAFHRATFNMYRGSITGNNGHASSSNTSTPDGGGVYMNNKTQMSDNGGIFNMYGGTISNNSATNGGGLFMCNNVGNIFRMYGGSITGNTATGMGGGVYSAGGDITMTGGSIDHNNASQGGGMYESGGRSVFFTMSGGSITDNTATGKGGGVYVSKGGNFKISGSVQITRNTKDSAANNVELAAGKTITIQSGLAEGASIGVTTAKMPETGDYSKVASGAEGYSLTEADANRFFSDVDQSAYTIKCADNQLILTKAGDNQLHYHPICGETCTHTNADGTSQHKNVYWEATSTLTSDMPAGYYYLTQNVTLTQSWYPAAGMVLDLNGHDIIMNADDYVISRNTPGAFTLTDCMGGQGRYGKITHGNNYKGGGIQLASPAFYHYAMSFEMYGGSITGNIGSYPGVCLEYNSTRSITFNMYGGEITNNKNTSTTGSYKGGGVYVAAGNTFTMTGGKITGNTTATSGGGVYVDKQSNKQGNFIVSGDAQITGNYKTDGTSTAADNVYLQSNTNGIQAYIKVNGALSDNASIGVSAGTIDESSYKIVAQGSNYMLTQTDVGHFNSDVDGYTSKLVDNSIAFTNGDPHEHKICGKTDCNDGHSNALWIPLTYDADTKTLKYGATEASRETKENPTEHYIYTLPAGNYYLAENIELDGSISISGNVNICLNGNTISTNKYCYGVFYFKNYKLTVCDCQDTGKILVANTENGKSVAVQISKSNASFDLYGGTISGGYTGVYTNCPVRLYGGTIEGNTWGVQLFETTLTIGGDAKVTGNTTNVILKKDQTITIDSSLTKDARIGITTSAVPTENTSVQIATGAINSDLDYSTIFIPDVKDQNYAIFKEDGNLYLGIHQHNWTYSAKEATITIKCNAENCNLGTDFAATYTVKAPDVTDLVYSGSEKPATVAVSDNATGLALPAVSEVPITYTKSDRTTLKEAPTDVGTYTASITLGGETASVTYAIVSKVVTNPTIEVSDAGTYDGSKKTPSVVVKDGDKEIPSTEYSVSYENNTDAGTATVTITDVAGGNYDVSGSTTFTIGKSTITVTPTAGQKIIYGMADPVLKYSFSGAENSEVPAFTGALSRAEGKDAGKYDITLGTLALEDNSAGSFKAANYELKLVDTTVQFEIVPKTLTAADLEFTTDSIFTKTYDKTTACTTAAVQIRSDAIVDENDVLPTVAGTYVYNSENVKDADKVIFTSEAASAQNYILPAGLTVEHEAKIDKAAQSYLIITSTTVPYGTDFDLTTIVSGGSGTGEVTYSVTNGSGAATITGSILHPVKVGEVTVVAVKAADDNHYQTTSKEKTITISRVDYTGTVGKTVNIIKNRGTAQSGTLTAADFFPEGAVPDGAVISDVKGGVNSDVVANMVLNTATGEFSYTSAVNITSTTDQTCTVTITSTNYENITATLTFHPTDKMTVTIDGLTYTDKTYDGSAMEPTGTLKVSDDKVPVSELEVKYEGTDGTNYSSTTAPTDAGTYKVTYKVADSNADYTGEKEYTFTISPKDVTANMIGAIAAQEYTGSAITPTPEVKDGNATLTAGTDFEFSYNKTTDVSENTATVTITGKGNYTGTASKTFTIKPKDIKGATITLQENSLIYTGQMQEVTIASVTLNGVTLSADDYDIVKDSNKQISADDAITLTIAGKGNYTGTATTTWKITKATPILGNFDVTGLSEAQTYDGTPKTVTAQTKNGVIDMGEVTVYYEGTSDTTYTKSATAPTNAGTYKVILSVAEGKNYTKAEIVAGTLTIEKADLTVEDVTEFFEYTKKGEQTISLAELVPGATNYTPGTYTDDNGILTGDLTIDATGLMKFTLSALTIVNIDNKVTVPVTITSENYKDVTVNVIIYISPEYRIIDGANSSWTQNTDGTVVIRGNGEFSKFHAVKVDGKVIDPANYDAKEGSTIITLKAEYLKTLATGSHTFAIVWNNGIAGTNFTVAANTSGNNSGNNSNNNDSNHGSDNSGNNDSGNTAGAAANTAVASAQELDKVPATGDPFGIWLTLFAISLTGLAGMLARRKKN